MMFSLAQLFSFRVINFIWMILLSVYAFKRWVLPGIESSIDEGRKNIESINNMQQKFQFDYDQIIKSTREQDILGKDLFLKIQEWQKIILKKEELQNQKNKLHSDAFIFYLEQQRNAVENIYIQRDISFEVHDVIQKELAEKYSLEKEQKDYIQIAFYRLIKGEK